MTRRGMKRWQPGGIPPWEHNEIVRRRKHYKRIAREIPRTNRAFRQIGDAAKRAAESLRDVRRALETQAGMREQLRRNR